MVSSKQHPSLPLVRERPSLLHPRRYLPPQLVSPDCCLSVAIGHRGQPARRFEYCIICGRAGLRSDSTVARCCGHWARCLGLEDASDSQSGQVWRCWRPMKGIDHPKVAMRLQLPDTPILRVFEDFEEGSEAIHQGRPVFSTALAEQMSSWRKREQYWLSRPSLSGAACIVLFGRQ